MAIIPKRKNSIEGRIESKRIFQEPRSYLSMSGIGEDCLRKQWYSWRLALLGKTNGHTPRISRLLNRGFLEEGSIIPDLIEAGCEVFRRKGEKKIPMTGEMGEIQELLIGFHRHAKGHPDGRITGVTEAPETEHVLEMKTMNDKNFNILVESTTERDYGEGIRISFPVYFGQMNKYMGKMKLKRALFVATNKNNSARKYIRVKFDKELFKVLEEREENIILSEFPPKRAYAEGFYKCNWCDFNVICYHRKAPSLNCRTCKSCDLMPEGKWSCSLTNKRLPFSAQVKGCKKYERLF